MRLRAPSLKPPVRTATAIALSLLLHLGGYALLSWAGRPPTVDFELAVPHEMELGVTEATRVQPTPPSEPAAEPPAAPQTPAADGPGGARDAAAAPIEDAAQPDASEHDAGGRDRPDGAVPRSPADAGRPRLAAYAPEGAQLSLRVHLARIADTDLADDVRALLAAVPDWRQVLGGSGIDPMAQLERLFIASPNLQRANIVIAGQYRGGVAVARRAVQSLARARGRSARWRRRGGLEIAPWHDRDATRRVIALIGPQEFVIARRKDLPRVLDIAQALAQRRTDGGTPTSRSEALLAFEEHQLLGFAVEGARHFVRGNMRGVPERLQGHVSHPPGGPLAVRVEGVYEDAQAARRARDYWNGMRERVAAHPLVALIGMRAPVARGSLETDGAELHAETRVTLAQARMLLGFVKNALTPVPAPGDEPPPRAPTPPNRSP